MLKAGPFTKKECILMNNYAVQDVTYEKYNGSKKLILDFCSESAAPQFDFTSINCTNLLDDSRWDILEYNDVANFVGYRESHYIIKFCGKL
jgi:hypothetical protein